MADKLAPTQNAQGMQQNVVGNKQSAVSTQGAASMGTAGTVGQATDVVGTKVSYRKSVTANAKQDTGNGGNNTAPTTTTTTTTPNTPTTQDDDDY
jgi:hypothetical protein